jgi:TolA-binding protein
LEAVRTEVQQRTQTFSEQIQKLEGKVFECETKNDKLQQEVNILKKEKDLLRDAVKRHDNQMRSVQKATNDSQQYSRKWNLRVFRVPEATGETAEDCIRKCVDIFSHKVQVPTTEKDIEVAHRTGQQSSSKSRPVLVRFFSRRKRDQILANRRKLKNKGIVIGEDLTVANYKLYRDAMQHSACASAWTSNGKVLAKLKNGKFLKLDIHTDVNQAFRRVMAGQNVSEEMDSGE